HPTGYGSWISFPRAFGTAPEPSMWGAYLVIVLGFVLGRLSQKIRAGDLVCMMLVGAGILVTFSRSAWLSVGVLLVFWSLFMTSSRVPRLALFSLAPAIVVWTLAPAFTITERL